MDNNTNFFEQFDSIVSTENENYFGLQIISFKKWKRLIVYAGNLKKLNC